MMKYDFKVNPPETEVAAVAKIAEMIAPYYVCTHGTYLREGEVGFGRQLWSLCSEDYTPRWERFFRLAGLQTLFDYKRDVFDGSDFPEDRLGWKVEYIDKNAEENQPHHFAFFYAMGVEYVIGLANYAAYLHDVFEDNRGDILLGYDAISLGAETVHIPGLDLSILRVGEKIMERFSRFQ